MHKKIFNRIKKYNTIVIARHIGPDPDSLGAQIGLKDIIINNFPNKNVYAVGAQRQSLNILVLLINYLMINI